MAYLPQIDASGIFTLKAPFDKLMTPQVVYVIRSIRSIGDILAAGETVFDRYYEPLGLKEADYQSDIVSDVKIVGLQAGAGEWVYVPASYILKAPDVNGVMYSALVLGVSLGAIPDDLNLDGTIEMVKNVVRDTLGVDPEVKAVLVAEPAMISRADHARLEAVRQQAISNPTSDAARAHQAEQALHDLRLKYEALENWVKSHVSLT